MYWKAFFSTYIFFLLFVSFLDMVDFVLNSELVTRDENHLDQNELDEK